MSAEVVYVTVWPTVAEVGVTDFWAVAPARVTVLLAPAEYWRPPGLPLSTGDARGPTRLFPLRLATFAKAVLPPDCVSTVAVYGSVSVAPPARSPRFHASTA